jgi:CheY-like chemotaxis protein
MVGSKRPVVLVVTNDRPLAQRSARTTQGRRFEMQFAATEKDALAALASAAPAGIVVDLPLSEEQACGLCREIRASAAGSRAALVVVARGEARFEALARLARPPEEIVRDPGSFADVLALTAEAIVVRERLGPLRDQVRRLETTIEERTATLERQIRFTGQIIDSLPVSLYVVDRGRTIVAWNRQREMGDQGLRREKALGRTLFDVFDHQSPDAIERELGPVFERSESWTIERETKIGGRLRHFRIHKLPCTSGGPHRARLTMARTSPSGGWKSRWS